VDAILLPPPAQAERLIAERRKMPKVPATFMIDTGAQRTAIDRSLAGELDLTPIRFEQIVGVSQKAEEYPVFRLVLQLRVSRGEKFHQYDYPTDVIGVPSPAASRQQHYGLLGRDFLQAWRLVYDGPSAVVEFEIRQ
jgi:hypothetical protein